MNDVIQDVKQFAPAMRFLLAAHGVAMVAIIGCHVFVSTYILKISQDLGVVGLYQITMFFSLTLTYYLIAAHCKQKRQLFFYRAGLTLYFLFFVAFALLKSRAVDYYLWLAMLYGIGAGLYWLPYTLYKADFSKENERCTFFSYETAIGKVVRILFPVSFGFLIWHTNSYVGLFIVTALMLAMVIPFSTCLDIDTADRNSAYDLRRLIVLLKGRSDLWNVYLGSFFCGISFFGALNVLIVILIYLTTGSELNLGIITSLLPVAGIASSLYVKRLKADSYGSVALSTAVLFFFSTLLLLWKISALTIIIFALCNAICIPILTILQNVYSYNVLEKHQEVKLRTAEHFVFREIWIMSGRAIGLSLLFLIPGISVDIWATKIVVVLLAAAVVLTAFFLQRIELQD